MPLPTEFPDGNGNSVFYGDYAGLTAPTGTALPLWSDTRNSDIFLCPGTAVPGTPPAVCRATEPSGITANDQDIFTSSLDVPSPRRVRRKGGRLAKPAPLSANTCSLRHRAGQDYAGGQRGRGGLNAARLPRAPFAEIA